MGVHQWLRMDFAESAKLHAMLAGQSTGLAIAPYTAPPAQDACQHVQAARQ
jgi:hypothetical protein